MWSFSRRIHQKFDSRCLFGLVCNCSWIYDLLCAYLPRLSIHNAKIHLRLCSHQALINLTQFQSLGQQSWRSLICLQTFIRSRDRVVRGFFKINDKHSNRCVFFIRFVIGLHDLLSALSSLAALLWDLRDVLFCFCFVDEIYRSSNVFHDCASHSPMVV